MKKVKVAYFSMEYAIHQSLKIYSGGLGFLSGSHMRSAHDLKQDVAGIGILYTYGYHDQARSWDGHMEVRYTRKRYGYLEDTGLLFTITVHDSPVNVRAWLLPPSTFGTAPVYLLSTDIPENDHVSRTICHRLYDNNIATRMAQSILLGAGGARLLELLKFDPDVYHLNESHALPLIFQLFAKYGDADKVRDRLVFTTHTPEMAGNYMIDMSLLREMSFFGTLTKEEIAKTAWVHNGKLDFTLTALHHSRIANAVSQKHGDTARTMWKKNEGICEIISITNAQNSRYWSDQQLAIALHDGRDEHLLIRKRELKQKLFDVVADQCGKLFDPNVLTIVWARRFAAYKRAHLVLEDPERFIRLLRRDKDRIQFIWAGKAFPEDANSNELFNRLVDLTNDLPGCAVLTGYELELSATLKKGADVWLNTPRIEREASGTSGMTAAMNGTINFSIADGWIPEFAKHGHNAFIIPVASVADPGKQDKEESNNLMTILEKEVIPTYYGDQKKWIEIMKNSMREVVPQFDSDRMAAEYFEKLYGLKT